MTGITFTREALDAEVEVLNTIVTAVRARQGSATQRLKDAQVSCLTVGVELDKDDDGDIVPVAQLNRIATVLSALRKGEKVTLGDIATSLVDYHEWADHARDEVVGEILKAQGSDEDIDALKTQYTAQREKVDALVVLFKAQKIDVSDLEIPTLRAARATSSAPRKAGSKYQQFYRILPNGERRNQSDRQNRISSMAWYYGAKMVGVETGDTNDGKGVSTPVLEKFLKDNGHSAGKPWSFVADGVTYGMDVVDHEGNSVEGTDEEE